MHRKVSVWQNNYLITNHSLCRKITTHTRYVYLYNMQYVSTHWFLQTRGSVCSSDVMWLLIPCCQRLRSSISNIPVSYTLCREYRVVRNRYSRLLITCKDRLCANLHVQERSTNITLQCQYLAFTWRHRSPMMTPQCYVRKDRPCR